MTTVSDPATQVYLSWVNSILCEAGLLLGSLDDLKSGVALATLIDILWPEAQLSTKVQDANHGDTSICTHNVQIILKYLTKQGYSHHFSPQDVVKMEESVWKELLWLVILHYNLHSPASAAYDHTEEQGTENLLEWCLLMLPGVTIDMQKPLVENISGQNLLVHLIAQFCPVEEDPEPVGLLMNAMLSAEEYLGISKYIVDPLTMVEGTIPERYVIVYLALLRRKSEQIEEMGSLAAEMAAAEGEDKVNVDMEEEERKGGQEITDPQEFLDMLGDQPITPQMLEELQDRFGPIEIEIIEDSSEASGDQTTSPGLPEEMDEDASPINVWPQQPIFLTDPGGKPGKVPLQVELEEAEEVERLSQELLHSRRSDDTEEDNDMNFPILGEASKPEKDTAVQDLTFDQEMVGEDFKTGSNFNSRSKRNLSESLKPPWMSPVPFSQAGNEGNVLESPGEHDHLRHSTPRQLSDAEQSESDSNNDEAVTSQVLGEMMPEKGNYRSEKPTLVPKQREMCYETEIDIEDLTKEEIQDLLIAAQDQGVPFDPRLIDLAAQRGLEFEIVMEDEDGNIIDGLPNGEPMRSTNFTELVNELKMASGQDMEVSLQYDSGVGTGTTIATGTDTDPESMGASMNVGMLQQQIRQHLSQTSYNNNRQYSQSDMVPNVPTTSLNDLRDFSDSEENLFPLNIEKNDSKIHRKRKMQNRRPESRKGNTRRSLFDLHDDLSKMPSRDGHNDDKDSISDEDENQSKASSAKSSDIDTDNEDGERRKWESNKSDKSFSSNTSVDGVIDTRADMDESEEEIVITMEVPGIPTEDGGFIIDMSKMFIPISIPGHGDQEITVEIDPSGFDFSSMVQNEDGTIEVDLEREVNKWMTQSASKFVSHGSGMKMEQDAENVVFPEKSKITEHFEPVDSEVNSAIRAAVTERFPTKSSSEESQVYTGPMIRPMSDSPASQPQHDTSSRSVDASATSSSLFDVSPAEDEVLQLLDQIGNKGNLMRRELENSHQREISLHHEKSEDEVRLSDTIATLEKELQNLKKENKKLYKDINSGRSRKNHDQEMIQRLEGAMDDLQGRVHSLQRENKDLKSLNVTLERRSSMVIHQGVMTDVIHTDSKTVQVGQPSSKIRSRASQTAAPNKVDIGVQQYGHYFTKNALTSTNDPIFRSLRTTTLGTQSESSDIVDRGVSAISAQEKIWFGHMTHASTQVRAVSKSHEPKKLTNDASTSTTNQQDPNTETVVKSEPRYPWQARRETTEQINKSQIIRAGKPLRPIHSRIAQRITTKTQAGPLKVSQASEKVVHQVNQMPTDCPVMENSATESMDTDDEPEGPDKWQRLSSASLATDDPTVGKLQRSLASATLENDLLQNKMKQSKSEMATRLEEWATLLEASKSELERAKNDTTVNQVSRRKAASVRRLEQKVDDLQEALSKAQKQTQRPSHRVESASPQPSNQAPQKVRSLEKQNAQLRSTISKAKWEKEQLIKEFSQLRQHHREGVEAFTKPQSSLMGMTNDRKQLHSEMQVLRDEYDYLRKGMDIMERFLNSDLLPTTENDNLASRSTSSCSHTSTLDDGLKDIEADITVVHRSEKLEAAALTQKDEKDGPKMDGVSSGGTDDSLHQHITALAARIQSELGIKVQLVGEVDPSEILSASIHSQDSGRSRATHKQDRPDMDAVDHLFQSVKPEGAYNKLDLTDLLDSEDILSRAIPSPRDSSRDSSPASPRQSVSNEFLEKKDIGSLDSAELRRKRLGMFVDAYTKPRESSPDGQSMSPVGRSPSPGKARRASRTFEEKNIEPSTDHQMKTHKESRHQIQSQSQLSPRDSSRSPTRSQDAANKSESMRKKLTTSNTPLLPSKFNLTSVGVNKNGGGQTTDSEASVSTGHPWSSSVKWKPFSRLARATRLKQEPRPPSTGLTKSNMEAEAALIQDDILLRYGGDGVETTQREKPAQNSRKVAHNSESNSKTRRDKKAKDSVKQSNASEPASRRSSDKGSVHNRRSSKVIETPTRPESDYSLKSASSNSWFDGKKSEKRKETKTVFKDYDYTDYLLSKYGGDDEMTDTMPLSEYPSDFRSSSAMSSLPSPDIMDDCSSSDTDELLSDINQRPSSKYYPHSSKTKLDPTADFIAQRRASSTASKPVPPTRNDTTYSSRPIKDSSTRSRSDTRMAEKSSSPSPSKASRTATTRPDPVTNTHTIDNTDSAFSPFSASISPTPVRLQSSPPLRSSYTPVPSPRSGITPQPWHSTRQSTYSPYTDTPPTSRPESRTFYSDFFNKNDSEDKYWKEPKHYDYRHDSSNSSPWRGPKRREAWGDMDRQWPDTSTTSSANLRLYTGGSTSQSPYESPSSGRSTPYQSLADQWTFSSSRVGAETDRSGRSSYLDRGNSSVYGMGRKSYDRPVTDLTTSSRSMLNKNIGSRNYDFSNETATPPVDQDVYSGAIYGKGTFSPQKEHSFIDNILNKYGRESDGSPSNIQHRLNHYDQTYSTTNTKEPFSSGFGRENYRPSVDMDRYAPSATPTFPPVNQYGGVTSMTSYPATTSYPASLYGSRVDSNDMYYGYDRYPSRTTSGSLTEGKERVRQAEIEELLNKYAPMY